MREQVKTSELHRQQAMKNRTKSELFVENQLLVNFKKDDYKVEYIFKHRRFDFYFPRIRVALEVDGGYHNEFNQKYKDSVNDKEFLINDSIRTIRIANNDVKALNIAIEEIKTLLNDKYTINGVLIRKFAPVKPDKNYSFEIKKCKKKKKMYSGSVFRRY